jgi:DNA-binding transcriptional ArsR family regulator
LSDPTRRRIVELLFHGERTAGRIAGEFALSRPAVSRHLRVLREAGLVQARDEGTRRIYTIAPAPLAELDAWLAKYRRFWAGRLNDLDAEISRGQEKKET